MSKSDDGEPGEENPEPQEPAVGDNVSVSDSSEEEEKRLESFPKDLSTATALKEAGNSAFKRNDFVEALARYGEGIQVLKAHVANVAAQPLLANLHGNCSMVHTKNSAWSDVIASASEALKLEENNVKSLFRRGVAYKSVGAWDDAKADLSRVLMLDEGNAAASKEVAEVIRKLKEHKQKEKSTFSSMFSKSMYADREQERAQKARREEEVRLKEQDEWTKSKLDRRSKGLEEQTFDDWKKEQDELRKADQERPPPAPSAGTDSVKSTSKVAKTNTSTDSVKEEDEEEYDEEESKIIAETKAKGYCYFRNELSSEVKTLIGDITPKTLAAAETTGLESNGNPSQAPQPTDYEKFAASSWNTAGTWEEREMTQEATDRLTAFCLEARATVAAGLMSDPQNLTSTLDAISANSGAADGSAGALLETLEASMASYSARVTKAKSITGDAQIVLARGKKRHIYDFNIELEFEVLVEVLADSSSSPAAGATAGATAGGEKKKPKKFKGVCTLPEVVPSTSGDGAGLEIQITYAKPLPPAYADKMNRVNDMLKADIIRRITSFETEFKSM